MDTSTTTSSPSQTWANYVSFRGLTLLSYKAIKCGLGAAGPLVGKAVSAAGKVFFGGGVEGMSHKTLDGSVSQNQPQNQPQNQEPPKINFPNGQNVDPEDANKEKPKSGPTKGGAGGTAEEKSKSGDELLDELKNRGKNPSSPSSALDLPSNASSLAKLNATMTFLTDQAKLDMDRHLGNALVLCEKNKKLAEKIKKQSEDAADLKEKASQGECSANKWGAWGQFCITVGGICGTLAQLPWPAILVTISPIAATISAALGAGFITWSCVRKGQAAWLTRDSEKIQAKVQLKRDKQSKNNTESSTLQSLFSIKSQEYNMMFSMWQAMIVSAQEAKRAIIGGIR